MSTNDLGFLCETRIGDQCSGRGVTAPQLQEWLDRVPTENECFEVLCCLNDVKGGVPLRDPVHQLEELERRFFDEQVPSSENPPQVVNPEELLGITKKVGLVCPGCKEQETSYKLFANRSADEGMTAYCNCRSCGNQWQIKM